MVKDIVTYKPGCCVFIIKLNCAMENMDTEGVVGAWIRRLL